MTIDGNRIPELHFNSYAEYRKKCASVRKNISELLKLKNEAEKLERRGENVKNTKKEIEDQLLECGLYNIALIKAGEKMRGDRSFHMNNEPMRIEEEE